MDSDDAFSCEDVLSSFVAGSGVAFSCEKAEPCDELLCFSEVVFCVVDVSTLGCVVVSDEGVACSLCETLLDSRDKGLLVDSMLADDASFEAVCDASSVAVMLVDCVACDSAA